MMNNRRRHHRRHGGKIKGPNHMQQRCKKDNFASLVYSRKISSDAAARAWLISFPAGGSL